MYDSQRETELMAAQMSIGRPSDLLHGPDSLNSFTFNCTLQNYPEKQNEFYQPVTFSTQQHTSYQEMPFNSVIPEDCSVSSSVSCPIRTLRFASSNTMDAVMLHHSINTHIPKTTISKPKRKPSKYKLHCSECTAYFYTMRQLETHIQVCHTQTQYSFECSICADTFISADLLKQHIQKHKLKDHSCEWCGRYYKWKSSLRKHMNVHYIAQVQLAINQTIDNIPERADVLSENGYYPPARKEKANVQKTMHDGTTVTQPKVRYQVCANCGTWFRLAQEYKQHTEHCNEPGTDLQYMLEPRQYACLACKLEFYTLEQLTTHVRRKHEK